MLESARPSSAEGVPVLVDERGLDFQRRALQRASSRLLVHLSHPLEPGCRVRTLDACSIRHLGSTLLAGCFPQPAAAPTLVEACVVSPSHRVASVAACVRPLLGPRLSLCVLL